MDEETREALKRNFDAAGNNPGPWLDVADHLRLAVSILEPHFPADLTKETVHERIVTSGQLQGPILMLRGCELECLLKALYVAGGNRLAEAGVFKPPSGKSHDLVALAQAAGLHVTPDESALLEYLGFFIVQGRYPIGKRAPGPRHLRGDRSPRATVWGEADEADYQAFRARLRAEGARSAKESGFAS